MHVALFYSNKCFKFTQGKFRVLCSGIKASRFARSSCWVGMVWQLNNVDVVGVKQKMDGRNDVVIAAWFHFKFCVKSDG